MINNTNVQKNLLILSLVLPLLSFNATAETDPAAYIGVGFGEVDIDTEGFDDPTGLELIGGYQFNNNFALEVTYLDFGEASDNESPDWEITADSLTAGIVGKIPLNANFEVFAKLGYHSWDVELSEDGYGKLGEDDGSDIFYGVGAIYNFGNGFGLGVRYNSYTFGADDDDTDVTMLSLNLQYSFQ